MKKNDINLYFFEANEPGYMYYEPDVPCPSLLCVLQRDGPFHDDKIYLNHLHNVTDKDVVIKITSVKNFPGYILSHI